LPVPREQVVRTPLAVREQSSRTLSQRILLRFPKLGHASFRLIASRPPGSRLRQATLSRAFRDSLEAYNRRDMDVLGIAYHPEFEYHPARKFVEAGMLEPSYRGLEGHKRYVATTAEVFASEVYMKPTELIDAGDRMAVLADVPMRAQASGIELTEKFALVSTIRDGLIWRIDEYYDMDEALAAVGLGERPE
jgi:ketosteroid isomerase-like protein